MDTVARFASIIQAPSAASVVDSPVLKTLLKACRLLPRGKGAVARLIGRLILRDRILAHTMPGGYEMMWSKRVIEQFSNATGPGWDEPVLKAILSVLKPEDVFYDVGANAGYMSLSVASHNLPNKIYAFEPLPELASALAASALSNDFPDFTVVRAALADRDEVLEFFLPSHSIHASLVSREQSSICMRVEGFRLDTLLENAVVLPPRVIKIDVEGAEMHVFRGAQETLRKHKPALIFECDENSLRFGHSTEEVLGFLRDLGYNSFTLLEDSKTTKIEIGELSQAPFGDFLALATSPRH